MDLSIGQTISNTFSTFGSRFGGLLGLWAIYFAFQIVLILLLFAMIGVPFAAFGEDAVNTVENPLAAGLTVFAMFFLIYIAYIAVTFSSGIAMTHYASPLHSSDFSTAFMAGLRRILTSLGLVFFFILAYIILGIALAIIAAILSMAGDAGSLLGSIGTMLVFVFIAARLITVFPIISVEGERNPISAITRSWSLTSGHSLPLFLTMLAFFVAFIVLVVLVSTVLGGGMAAGLSMGANSPADFASFGTMFIVMLLVFAMLGALFAMISASFMAHVHAKLSPTASVSATFE